MNGNQGNQGSQNLPGMEITIDGNPFLCTPQQSGQGITSMSYSCNPSSTATENLKPVFQINSNGNGGYDISLGQGAIPQGMVSNYQQAIGGNYAPLKPTENSLWLWIILIIIIIIIVAVLAAQYKKSKVVEYI